jgi:alpha-galactosidase
MCALLAGGAAYGAAGDSSRAWPDPRGDQAILNDIGRGTIPFRFTLDGVPSAKLLPAWKKQTQEADAGQGRLRTTTTWADPNSGLRLTWELTRFADFPAAEWLLWFENADTAPTGIIEDVQAMDLVLPHGRAAAAGAPFVLHRTNGAPSNPTDYMPSTVNLGPGAAVAMGGGGGRSSNRDFPFFRIDTGPGGPQADGGAAFVAVGWSGQWKAQLACGKRGEAPELHVAAGLELTHFRLLPGERVRSPRMLVLFHAGDPADGHCQFRRLILRHYAATPAEAGKTVAAATTMPAPQAKPDPTLFCNTCFTRGGGWLNECNEENQVSLIRALAGLGVQAVITDAGWFRGGWPQGAGNWDVDLAKYPKGMAPVAAAAKEHGMTYGLWFEPERVVAGTAIDREHAPWVLRTRGSKAGGLLNFGLADVRKHFFGIVEGYMKLPGFRVYRQDFNMDPLANWRDNDAPDRQGMAEMKYIEGLYAYWDMIRQAWPDALMEECASGGRRTDIETVMRFHVHQKSDYWFDNVVDQGTLWSLSRWLPNGLISVPLCRLDDYSFHSALASSLIVGWIADDPKFDGKRAKALTDTYRRVRPLLNGDWYAVTEGGGTNPTEWLASQYHRADLDEGMVLAFRRDKSPYVTIQARLRGLDPAGNYELTYTTTGRTARATGQELAARLDITLPQGPSSELIVYRRAR